MKVRTYWLAVCLFIIFSLVGYIIFSDWIGGIIFGGFVSTVGYGWIMIGLGIWKPKKKRRIYGYP